MRRAVTAAGGAARGPGRLLLGYASDLAAYPADLATTVARSWRRFFFTPADPTPLGLVRISVGLLLVWNFLTLWPDLRDSLGDDAWADPGAVREFWQQWKDPRTAWSLWMLVPDRFLPAAWAGVMLVLVLFTAGFLGRITALLSWMILASTIRRAPVLFFGFDQTVLTWTMYLAFTGTAGQALSVDRLLARRRHPDASRVPPPTVSANLALRLIQLHLCLIYAVAGLSKLQGNAWWNGSAVLMILLSPEYRVGDKTWLAAYPRALNFLTHATVAMETLYPILVWIRVFRPLVLASMIVLHLGIDWTLGLTEFSLAMIAANLAFIPGRWLRGRPGPAPDPAGG